jgi:hypothetical protein
MKYLNINRIIDVQSSISPVPSERRDFSIPCFVYKGEIEGGLFQSYADVVTAFGSNSEPAKASQKFFSGGFRGVRPKNLYIKNVSATATWGDEIVDLLSDPRYFHVAVDNTFTDEEQVELANAIEASTIKYFGWFLSTEEENASVAIDDDTTSFAKAFYTSEYEYNGLFFDNLANVDEYKQVSAMSYFATVDFTVARPLGQLAYKTMSGQTPTDLGSQPNQWATNLEAKNCNYYTAFGEQGRNMYFKGVNSAGRFIDVIIGACWLDYNLAYNIFDLLTALPKLSFTNADFNKLYSVMAKVFEQAKDFGLIGAGTDSLTGIDYPNGYEINIPKASSISLADKTAGVLKGINNIAILSGNVVKFEITNLLNY